MALYEFIYILPIWGYKSESSRSQQNLNNEAASWKAYGICSYFLFVKNKSKTILLINATLSQMTQIKSCPRYSIRSDEEFGRLW